MSHLFIGKVITDKYKNTIGLEAKVTHWRHHILPYDYTFANNW